MEKLNGFSIKYYSLCTNKNNKKNKFLAQLIKKRNRIEFLTLNGDYDEFRNFEEDQSDLSDESDV